MSEAVQLPHGKALWIRERFRDDDDAARAFVRRYIEARFTWASPLALWGSGTVRDEPALHRALSEWSVPVWPLWGLPEPGEWREALDRFLDHAVAIGAAGVIVDPEVEWKGHREEAAEFAAALREGCDRRGLALAITSYALPDAHPTFPWEEFAAVADVGIPQAYDRDVRTERTYGARALRQYRARGFRQVIIGRGLWNHAERRDKNAREVRAHLALTPVTSAVIFWSDGSISPVVWRVLAAWRGPGTRGFDMAAAAGVAALAAGAAVAISRARRR